MSNENSAGEPGLLRGLWAVLSKPTSRWSLGGLLAFGIVTGVILWGGFNWMLELTNTETFCLSCHEMEQNTYREYRGTIHDANRSGVRATCPDCHVPRPWFYKMKRKIQASNEVLHKLLGSIDSREKFEAKRIELATHVWTAMKETDSRECRNCHNFGAFDLTRQATRARNRHAEAEEQHKTCIDCHKGIAHQLPAGAFKAERDLNESMGGAAKP
jgi:cytochrome c-type protein NapC